jgi:hypothetical protein
MLFLLLCLLFEAQLCSVSVATDPVHLPENSVGAKGAVALAAALEKNNSLQFLDLGCELFVHLFGKEGLRLYLLLCVKEWSGCVCVVMY